MTLKPCSQTTSFKTNRLLKEYWEVGAKWALLFEMISLGGDTRTQWTLRNSPQARKKNTALVPTTARIYVQCRHRECVSVSAEMETHTGTHTSDLHVIVAALCDSDKQHISHARWGIVPGCMCVCVCILEGVEGEIIHMLMMLLS